MEPEHPMPHAESARSNLAKDCSSSSGPVSARSGANGDKPSLQQEKLEKLDPE